MIDVNLKCERCKLNQPPLLKYAGMIVCGKCYMEFTEKQNAKIKEAFLRE